ncbi:hypothetical protein [Flammeovirga aprica]|uniref:Uncharacterized protein n=1 Tax=Flammeovirga aprica JL-4 TaxID=694437 RepID=A0A7X9RUN6_9BACT|nr:hypothetical protein [Flammeovirga aprica]NME69034.1 hypothetical protein [Flammeovirga aprica JL-4]
MANSNPNELYNKLENVLAQIALSKAEVQRQEERQRSLLFSLKQYASRYPEYFRKGFFILEEDGTLYLKSNLKEFNIEEQIDQEIGILLNELGIKTHKK